MSELIDISRCPRYRYHPTPDDYSRHTEPAAPERAPLYLTSAAVGHTGRLAKSDLSNPFERAPLDRSTRDALFLSIGLVAGFAIACLVVAFHSHTT